MHTGRVGYHTMKKIEFKLSDENVIIPQNMRVGLCDGGVSSCAHVVAIEFVGKYGESVILAFEPYNYGELVETLVNTLEPLGKILSQEGGIYAQSYPAEPSDPQDA